MEKKTILLGLNELNFDYIQSYVSQGYLKNFEKLLDTHHLIETESEKEYRLLEPWIQWVTLHTGKSYDEHKIFRLGDIINFSDEQIFESLESKGLTVGAVSPFNAKNNLKDPVFFIPDPWTNTKVSGNWLISSIYTAISRLVNENANNKFNLKSILILLLGYVIVVPISEYRIYAKLFFQLRKPGIKAIVLDKILANLFLFLVKEKKPDFSLLFLNSGAHIQHHYLFNSRVYEGELSNPNWYCKEGWDPLLKVLENYDRLIGKLIRNKKYQLILATGLHQQPHIHNTYYWRLKNHHDLLASLGVEGIQSVSPRMSRDFLIEFLNEETASTAEKLLNSCYLNSPGNLVFSINNRGTSLFVELIYSEDIQDNDHLICQFKNLTIKNFKSMLSFVAIKNGEHNGIGYLLIPSKYQEKKNKIELKDVRNLIEKIALN